MTKHSPGHSVAFSNCGQLLRSASQFHEVRRPALGKRSKGLTCLHGFEAFRELFARLDLGERSSGLRISRFVALIAPAGCFASRDASALASASSFSSGTTLLVRPTSTPFRIHGFAEREHFIGARIADAERHQRA
jgi:hypothetical protein